MSTHGSRLDRAFGESLKEWFARQKEACEKTFLERLPSLGGHKADSRFAFFLIPLLNDSIAFGVRCVLTGSTVGVPFTTSSWTISSSARLRCVTYGIWSRLHKTSVVATNCQTLLMLSVDVAAGVVVVVISGLWFVGFVVGCARGS